MASTTPDPVIAEARKRWTKCADAEADQRARILLAKQFRAGDQWPAAIKRAREGAQSLAGVPAQPPRPCLVVDRLSQPVRQTSNTIKNAEFGFDVLPNGGGADTETAAIYKGYMRRVHNDARGDAPVEWAADQAIEGGIGWFRLRTEYVHTSWDGDPNDPEVFDQELRLERVTNNLSVYCDPSAMRPTRRDAQFMFITEDLDKDAFRAKYPDADVAGLEAFMTTGDMPGWISPDTIRIAEYWRVDYTRRTFCKLRDGTIVEKTKGGPTYAKADIEEERVMRVPSVSCDVITAVESLAHYDWVGRRIPIFPILGEELNVDGKPYLRGLIEPGMDPQRMLNYSYSGAIEIFALAPRAPWVTAAGQVENHPEWKTANVYSYSHLNYDPVAIGGELVPAPQRQVYDAPIAAAVQLMRTSEEAIKATTSTGDASLGNSNPNERSGRALQALQAQSDLANSNYPDNVRRALIDCADEMAVVIPKITRPGQILQILGLDDEPQQVMVGQPFAEGPDGVPQPAPEGVTPEQAKLKESLYQFYDLNSGRYAVTVSVGKATATKREEGAAALGELIPHLNPEMAAVATPDFVEQLSFPGAFKIAEKLRKALPPHLQEQKDGAAPDPELLVQQVQQLTQQLQQATQFIQTEQAKQQGHVQAAQLDASVKAQTTQAELQQKMAQAQAEGQIRLEIARMDNATRLQIEEFKLRGTLMQREIDAREAQLGAAQAQEAQSSAQQHEAGLARMGQDAQREQQETGHAQALEQAEQSAALQPPPAVESQP